MDMSSRRTLVGTCGYSYDEWRGAGAEILYPEGLPKAEFISLYSRAFPFVELDYSYYGMPKAASLATLAAKAPHGFLFSLKAHKSLSHERPPDWRDRAAELAAFPLAVEFRNDEWQAEGVLAELDRRGAALVLVDRPDLPGLPPPSTAVTGGWSYLRYHGRNAEAWWTGGATGRYDYLYSADELRGTLPMILSVEEKAELLLIAFNNHSRGRAVVNARMLRVLLDGE
jgi:uncharacterized protein YecE (DUF72 family)